MRKRLALIGATVALAVALVGGAAHADPSVGESGHSNNGSTQCQAGGTDHCPPFGTDK